MIQRPAAQPGFGHIHAIVCPVVDGITNQLERYMDLLSARQKLVASNIANIDTPGYKSQDINFQSEFQNATGGGNLETTPVNVIDTPGLVVKSDGNNVSLDREGLALARTQLQYRVGVELLRTEFHSLQSAINEGK